MWRIAKNKKEKNRDCKFAVGLTWSKSDVVKAYSAYKKLLPHCILVKVKKRV